MKVGRVSMCCSVLAGLMALSVPATGQAGVIPFVYDAIFGPPGSMSRYFGPQYTAAPYAPTYVQPTYAQPTVVQYRAYYVPTTTYAPVSSAIGCAPCQVPCAPCQVSCAPCDTKSCTVGYRCCRATDGKLDPEPDPATYDGDAPDTSQPREFDPEDDDGFRKRNGEDEGNDEDGGEDENGGETNARRVGSELETKITHVIPRSKPTRRRVSSRVAPGGRPSNPLVIAKRK